jgi:Ni/Co efflux regulator RcnB
VKKILTAMAAISIVASAGIANAQPGPSRHDDPHHNQPGPPHAQQPAPPHRAPPPKPRHDDRYERRAQRQFKAGRYQPPRGYHARQWRRGDRLPANYRTRTYVVDYRRYALAPPPRGYQYVRVGNDVMLTAIATGVISSVIMQLFN